MKESIVTNPAVRFLINILAKTPIKNYISMYNENSIMIEDSGNQYIITSRLLEKSPFNILQNFNKWLGNKWKDEKYDTSGGINYIRIIEDFIVETGVILSSDMKTILESFLITEIQYKIDVLKESPFHE